MIEEALARLLRYAESEDYAGYDPYDTLNSPLPFHWLGKWGPVLAIQFQKRNPLNIRPLLGVRKGRNPKGVGLFLRAYSLLYQQSGDQEYLRKAEKLFTWLREHPSKGYSSYCWGYNFPWASPVKHLGAYEPSVVVTGFVAKGLHEYYHSSGDERVIEVMEGAVHFVLNQLPRYEDETGVCISYTPVMKDACYNASLLGAELLARYVNVLSSSEGSTAPRYAAPSSLDAGLRRTTRGDDLLALIESAVNFVVNRQQFDGRWNYSLDLDSGKERVQIDFHQGYVIESIEEIMRLTGIRKPEWEDAVRKGLTFYRNDQFFEDGRSKWRLPKEWPVEIHNQAQGIVTFSMFDKYRDFARVIPEYTIREMQDRRGYFYYQKFPWYTNRISYMRWSNAWMAVALSTVLNHHG